MPSVPQARQVRLIRPLGAAEVVCALFPISTSLASWNDRPAACIRAGPGVVSPAILPGLAVRRAGSVARAARRKSVTKLGRKTVRIRIGMILTTVASRPTLRVITFLIKRVARASLAKICDEVLTKAGAF